MCELFYKQIINTKKYKLTKLKSMTNSEFCKVLKILIELLNSFIDEWLVCRTNRCRYVEVKAIKYRKTHSNIKNCLV